MAVSRTLKCTVILFGALIAHAAFADKWFPASTEQYVSADGAWRLTVEPRPITSPLNYFQDAEDGKERSGSVPGSNQASAMGTMERRIDGAWQPVWERPLRNDVAPVAAVALPGGEAMTLDNWHSMGHGQGAVVLYNAQGTAVAAYALTDFLPKDYVRALPRSVSSINWRGEPKALPGGKRVSVPVFVPSENSGQAPRDDGAQFVPVIFDLEVGRVEPPAGADWERAEQAARQVLAKQLLAEAEWRRRFIEPLQVPASAELRDWHRYLDEAFLRLDPDWREGTPETIVLRSPAAPDYHASFAWIRDALRREDREGALMLASPSQDALLERIEAEAKRVRGGALSQASVYLALDDSHFARARSALMHSGANLIQIDPATAISQRPERLEQFMREQEAPDEE